MYLEKISTKISLFITCFMLNNLQVNAFSKNTNNEHFKPDINEIKSEFLTIKDYKYNIYDKNENKNNDNHQPNNKKMNLERLGSYEDPWPYPKIKQGYFEDPANIKSLTDYTGNKIQADSRSYLPNVCDLCPDPEQLDVCTVCIN